MYSDLRCISSLRLQNVLESTQFEILATLQLPNRARRSASAPQLFILLFKQFGDSQTE